MSAPLIRWWQTRKVVAQHAAHLRGYDWAAGILLRANDLESAEAEIDSFVEGAIDRGAFDAGAIEACRRWRFRCPANPA